MHFTTTAVVTGLAGWMMIASGFHKRLLERSRHRICPSCGRELGHRVCEACRTAR